MTLRTLAGLIATSMLLALVGCDSDISRHTGQLGEFVFEYDSEKDTHNFNKPIVVGGRLELSVYCVGQEHAVVVTAAHSDSPGTLMIDHIC